MPAVKPRQLSYEGGHFDEADFVAGKDNDTQLSAGTVGEIATIEIGEDGKFSAYDAVRPGDFTDTEDPTRGRIFVELADGGTVVADKVQWRLITRDKNSNRRIPITTWYRQRDSNASRPDHRTVLRPISRNDAPFFIKAGRIVALEVKNESSSVTVDINDTDTVVEVPGRFGN
jgi:hypothetical protein